MNVEQLIEKMRGDYPNYTISISERDSYGSVVVRVSADGQSVSVIKDDNFSLEEVMEEAIDRLDCLVSGTLYCVRYKKDTIEEAVKFLKLTLQEMAFDKAVSLVEKLNRY